MAFFNSYWDVSGKIYDSPFLVMAGYVAPTPQWERFVEEWDEILKRENIKVWHMTDFEAKQGKYKGWDQERSKRVYQTLIESIKKYISVGIASAVEVKAFYEHVIGEDLQRHFGEHPYKFCLLNCMAQVKRWAEENEISERVVYVLESGDEGHKEVFNTLYEFLNDEASCQYWRLGPLTTVEKKDPAAIPCQAADILAWECRKELVEKRVID